MKTLIQGISSSLAGVKQVLGDHRAEVSRFVSSSGPVLEKVDTWMEDWQVSMTHKMDRMEQELKYSVQTLRDQVKMVNDTSEVKLRIRERFIVQITPSFKCSGVWPRSAAHWPLIHIAWPHPHLAAQVKTEGFDLLSKECLALQGKQSAMEGDAWVISFREAEAALLLGGSRKKCLSILKTLRDRHLDLQVRQ